MGDEITSEKSKAVMHLMALAKIELDAGRTAKGTRLLREATDRAADLEGFAATPEPESAIQHSTVVSDLRTIYGLGGIPKAGKITRR